MHGLITGFVAQTPEQRVPSTTPDVHLTGLDNDDNRSS